MISYLIASIVDFLFSFTILLKKRSRLGVAFSLICITTSVYAIEIFFLNYIKDLSSLEPLFIFSRIGLFFLLPSILNFTLKTVDIHKKQKLILIPFLLNAIFLTVVHTFFVPSELYPLENGFYPEEDFIFIDLKISFATGIIIAIGLLFWGYRQTTNYGTKKRILWIMFGYTFAFLFGMLAFSKNTGLFGMLGNIFGLSCVLYAIIKYRLIDFPIFLSKIITKTFTTGVFVTLFYLLVLFYQSYFPNTDFYTLLVLGSIFAFLSFEIYPFVYKFVQTAPDSVLLRMEYNLKEVIRITCTDLKSCVTVDDLLSVLKKDLAQILISKAYLYLPKKVTSSTDEEVFYLWNKGEGGRSNEKISPNDPLIHLMKSHKNLVLAEEITEDIQESLENLGGTLAIPCINKESLLGFVVIGGRENRSFYSHDDLTLFEILISQIGLVLERISLYEQFMEDFQKTKKTISLVSLMNEYNHDIKAPFAVLESALEAVDDLDELKEMVARQAGRGRRLVEKMVKILNGDRKIYNVELNLNDVIQNALELFPVRVGKKILELDVIPNIIGDFEELEILFINLFKNAIESMVVDSMNNKLYIKTYHDDLTKQVIVKITDTGAGISEEKLKNLWNIKDNPQKGKSGLGLSVVQRIVAEHNGKISVDSKVGYGTNFIIQFPIAIKNNIKNS